MDDPFLFEDDDDGGTQEIPAREEIGLWSPPWGTYTVVVTYHSDHHTQQLTSPWVELELAGSALPPPLQAPKALAKQEAWVVLELEWPDLELTILDEITTHEALGGPPINE